MSDTSRAGDMLMDAVDLVTREDAVHAAQSLLEAYNHLASGPGGLEPVQVRFARMEITTATRSLAEHGANRGALRCIRRALINIDDRRYLEV